MLQVLAHALHQGSSVVPLQLLLLSLHHATCHKKVPVSLQWQAGGGQAPFYHAVMK